MKLRVGLRPLLGAVVVALGSSGSQLLAGQPGACTGVNHVTWPTVNPVWDFCWVRPAASAPGNGSGIELVDVKYNGTLILARAHLPILNVKYEPNPSGCGSSNLCYRDWFFQERDFQCAPCQDANGATVSCSSSQAVQCTGTTTPAATVCESCSIAPVGCEDIGVFSGVAVENLGTSLKLTSQTEAGWYRYIPVWEFFPDGRIEARFVATSVDHTCVAYDHVHHAYFRLDFDLNGAADDFVDEVLSGPTLQRVSVERNFSDASPTRSKWQVGSPGSPYLVEVARNAGDGGALDAPGVPNDFPVADGWVLAYNAGEISDYQNTSSGCAANLNPWDNNQNVNGADVVLWVSASALHHGEPGGESDHCVTIGPTIRVLPGTVPTGSKFHTLDPCRVLDTRNPAGPYGAPPLAPGDPRSFVLQGQCGIPVTAKSVAVNLTVVAPASTGNLIAYPTGGSAPTTSVLNFSAGQTRANNAVLGLGTGGAVTLLSNVPSGNTQVVLDVTGWFE